MFIRRFIELLAPTNCLGCGVEGAVLCTACLLDAGRKAREKCFQCLKISVGGATCVECRPLTRLAGVSVGTGYDGAVKELIWRLKFHRLREAAEVAAFLVVKALPKDLVPDVVTSVPVAPVRYRERGYNQSELVARQVAARLGLPYTSLLGRVNAVHQIGLGREERLEQIDGAFYSMRNLSGQRVLVVDDVVTTGATLSECAKTLAAAGTSEVWGAVVARRQLEPLE